MELVVPKLMATKCVWLHCSYGGWKKLLVFWSILLIQCLVRFYSGKSGLLSAVELAMEPGVCCQGCSGIPERLNLVSNCCKQSFIKLLLCFLPGQNSSKFPSKIISKILTFGGIQRLQSAGLGVWSFLLLVLANGLWILSQGLLFKPISVCFQNNVFINAVWFEQLPNVTITRFSCLSAFLEFFIFLTFWYFFSFFFPEREVLLTDMMCNPSGEKRHIF